MPDGRLRNAAAHRTLATLLMACLAFRGGRLGGVLTFGFRLVINAVLMSKHFCTLVASCISSLFAHKCFIDHPWLLCFPKVSCLLSPCVPLTFQLQCEGGDSRMLCFSLYLDASYSDPKQQGQTLRERGRYLRNFRRSHIYQVWPIMQKLQEQHNNTPKMQPKCTSKV